MLPSLDPVFVVVVRDGGWSVDTTISLIAALATLAATVTAVFLAVRGGRERNRQREDDERAQARSLTVTTEKSDGTDPYWEPHEARVTVHNHGTLPVLAVTYSELRVSPGNLGPADSIGVVGGKVPVLAPGEKAVMTVSVMQADTTFLDFTATYPSLATSVVTYRDAAGRKWKRWENADPVRQVVRPQNFIPDPTGATLTFQGDRVQPPPPPIEGIRVSVKRLIRYLKH